MPIIDSDTHVIETERTWDYMAESEAPFRPKSLVPSDPPPKEVRGGHEFWMIDGKLHPRRDNIGAQTTEAAREMADVEERLRHMDTLGVDVQILFPTVFLEPITDRPEVEVALCRSYNRWMADIWRQGKGRLRWTVVLPWYSLDKAVDELRFGKENGACGIFARYAEAGRPLNAPYFYPVYQEANALNLPVCVHASTGTFATHELFNRAGSVPKFKLGPIGAFHTIAVSKIPDLFPNLRFGFLEVQAQWIPYICHDLYRRSKANLPSAPAYQTTWWKDGLLRQRRLYVACQTDDDLPYVLQYAGQDNLVVGSDYGHNDTSSEIEALGNLQKKGDVDASAINKILYDNAKALYAL